MKYTDGNQKIVICKHCNKPEYWGQMRWLSGICSCRDCYKRQWERENHKMYVWNDLDGNRPTRQDYENQDKKQL